MTTQDTLMKIEVYFDLASMDNLSTPEATELSQLEEELTNLAESRGCRSIAELESLLESQR